MKSQVEFGFASEMTAYRFLNTVKHMDVDSLVVKFGRNDRHVLVSYRYAVAEFDSTLSELDDLARELGGEEV